MDSNLLPKVAVYVVILTKPATRDWLLHPACTDYDGQTKGTQRRTAERIKRLALVVADRRRKGAVSPCSHATGTLKWYWGTSGSDQTMKGLAGNLPAPAAIAFDLDGTLVDTVPARIKAWVQALREGGISIRERSVASLIGSDGKHVARESARVAGQILDDHRAEVIDRRQGEIFEALNTDPRPLPASRALLILLDARGIPWAIATSSRPEQVGASVKGLNLPRPPTIIDSSDVGNAKPAPDVLIKTSRLLGIQPHRFWYVGDSTWDMRAAKAASMVAVGVTAGSAVRAHDLRAAGATVVCRTLHGVIELLGETSGQSNQK